MFDQIAKTDRTRFLVMAFLFQGALFLVGLLGSVAIGQPAWTNLSFDAAAVGMGIVGTLPMLIILWFVYRTQMKSLVTIRQLLRDVIGEYLIACRWWDLCLLALLAGVSEECLFRGALQPWLSRIDPLFGLAGCSLIFGLCHAVTPTYAILAALIGAYLGSMLWWTEKPNLLIPILCHSLYDLVAFVVVRHFAQLPELQLSPNHVNIITSQVNADHQDSPAHQ